MNILIVGCSREGASLASIMCERGHDVSVLDSRRDSFELLEEGFTGLTFKGVPIDNDDLQSAGIESCDVVCALTDDDNVNIMVAQIAKEVYKVHKVLTKIMDPEKEEVYEVTGLNSVCPTNLTLDAFISALDGYQEEQQLGFAGHTVKFYPIPIPRELIGMRALDIRFEKNEVLYAIVRAGGHFDLINNYNVSLREGDTLIFSRLVD